MPVLQVVGFCRFWPAIGAQCRQACRSAASQPIHGCRNDNFAECFVTTASFARIRTCTASTEPNCMMRKSFASNELRTGLLNLSGHWTDWFGICC